MTPGAERIESRSEERKLGKSSAEERRSLQSAPLADLSSEFVSEWSLFQGRCAPRHPMHDPKWLSGYFEGQEKELFVHSLRDGGQLKGVAAFLRKEWPMKWQIGEFTLARFPLTRLRLLGGEPTFPHDEAAYDLLFKELLSAERFWDAIYLEELPVDSFLWKYLESSTLIRKAFARYQPERPSSRPLLRIEGTFQQYMGKFKAKHRKNLLREIKRLRDGALGEMRFVRFELPEEVLSFLDAAVGISRKTYQWNLHGRGLSNTTLVRQRLMFAARNGWMRCYLLICGERPCAFVLGFQHEGCFLLDEIGFDPELAKYSVGTVLQFLVVEDLFSYDRPVILDLQDYGTYKDVLATESYLQGKMFLFRPGTYARLLCAGDRGARIANRSASALLEWWSLKSKVKQRVRGWKKG